MTWFDTPLALALLIVLFPALWLSRRWLRRRYGWRGDLSLALRALGLTCLVIALAQPQRAEQDSSLSIAYAVDVSKSVSPDARAAAWTWLGESLRAQLPTDRAAVVAFGGLARVVRPLSTGSDLPAVDAQDLQPATSNVRAALALAASLVRGQRAPRVILLSDGQGVASQVEAMLPGLNGIAVDVYPLQVRPSEPSVAIESLRIPAYAWAGEATEGSLVVQSSAAVDATLQVAVDGSVLSEEPLHLKPGQNRLQVSPRISTDGFHSLALRVLPSDGVASAHNVALGYVTVRPRPRVLVIEDRDKESADLQAALKRANFAVEVRTASALPTPQRLGGFAGVVLYDVAATSFSLDQQKTLLAYVAEQGHGLLVLGGPTGYSLGGYTDSVLEQALPVWSKPPERREDAPLALLLLLDRSASMDRSETQGVTSMQMVKQAAVLATRELRAQDEVGVLVFDRRSDWLVPLARMDEVGQPNVEQTINSITAEGGTDIYGALVKGLDGITRRPVALKHMVLLSDGQSLDANYQELANRLKLENIGLSTVAVGHDADTDLMSRLARWGKGRYYFTDRPLELPRILTQEAALARRGAVVEGRIVPQLQAPSPILRSIAPNVVPPLAGFLATTPKPTAQVVLATEDGTPLLAQWQYGLGRAVAWTGDLSAKWSPGWLAWDQDPLFWEQALRWSMGNAASRDLRIETQRVGNVERLMVENSRDGQFVDLEPPRTLVTAPDGTQQTVELGQVAPGQYTASVMARDPGVYRVTVTEPIQNGRSETTGFVVPPVVDAPSLAADERALRRIAAGTGGRRIEAPADIYADDALRGPPDDRSTPLWPPFAIVALATLVLDVAVRRLRFARFLFAAALLVLLVGCGAPQAAAVAPTPTRAPAVMATPDASVEYHLATLEENFVVADDPLVADLRATLDRLAPRCQESRDKLGDLTAQTVDALHARGLNEVPGAILLGVTWLAESLPPEKIPARCEDLFKAFVSGQPH
jgi:uncharacterized membrane protein